MSGSQTRVSAIVPLLGSEKDLRATLESLLEQELGETEILCAGNDAEGVVAEMERADPRIRFLECRRRCCGSLLNLGLEEAVGDYVAFLAPGSIAEPRLLGKLLRLADEEGLDIVQPAAMGGGLCGRVLDPCAEHGWAMLPADVEGGLYRRELLEGSGIRFSASGGTGIPAAAFRFLAYARAGRAWLLRSS